MRENEQYIQKIAPKSGSFAYVSGCEDKQTGELVAIKQLKKEHRDNQDYLHRFRREVSLLEQLAPHPNIVPVLDKHLEDDEDCWYVMPYANSNLGDFLEKHNNTLSLQHRIDLFDAVLAAITHAHHQQVLHRDLAPTNILMYLRDDGESEVKVADFGLGRDLASETAHTKTAHDGYGHLFFTAPEQLDSLRSASYQSDIYALGKILNYVCTGRIPRKYYPCAFGTVIKKATEDAVENRYTDIEAFTLAYEQIKELLLKSQELTSEERVRAYAEGSAQIDWHDFHRFAVAGEYTDHVYHDYLEPVARVLGSAEATNAYYSAVGSAIEDFAVVYIDRIEQCLGTTRWPFSETDNFGRVLYRIYQTVSSPDLRIECLKELWRLAYQSDQWAVQRLVESIFSRGLLPAEREIEVVEIIRNSKVQLNNEQLRKLLGPTLPRLVRRVLQEISA